MIKRKSPGFYPTKQQFQLLSVLLHANEESINSWRNWRNENNLSNMDEGSYRLIPLLYQRLKDLKLDNDDILLNFKEIYLKFWSLNENLIHHAKNICSLLLDGGIQPLIIKGGAMLENYYEDVAYRPMGDIDIFVKKEEFVATIEKIRDHGWKVAYSFLENDEDIFLFPALDLVNNNGIHLDIHWEIITRSRNNISQQMFFEDSVAFEFFGVKVKSLCPTDQLFHTCIHGAKWNRIPSIRWIVDAHCIVSDNKSNIDWVRFVKLAKLNHLSTPAFDTIRLLKSEFHLNIPEFVLNNLKNENINLYARIKYRSISRPFPIIWDLFNKLFMFLDMFPDIKIQNFQREFIRYNKVIWNIPKEKNIVVYILRLILRKIYFDVFTSPYFSRKNIDITK